MIKDADGDYGSEGLLIWLPLDSRYGTWDSSHNIIFAFEQDTTWADIARAPARYLDAQWGLEDAAPMSYLKPWVNHVYNGEQVFRRFPYPAEWFYAQQTLRGNIVEGVQTRTPRMVKVELSEEDHAYVLHATVSHMDNGSNWLLDQEFSRTLNPAEQTQLREMVQEKFWEVGELTTDLGEPAIVWSLEGFEAKRFRSISQFYSDQPTRDSVAELGEWVLELAGLPRLESYLT